jgi:hypothetical protein
MNDHLYLARRLQDHLRTLNIEFDSLIDTLRKADQRVWARHFYIKQYHVRQSILDTIRRLDPDNHFHLPIPKQRRRRSGPLVLPQDVQVNSEPVQISQQLQTLTPEELAARDERAAQIRRKLGLNTD